MKSEELRRALHKITDLEQAPNVSESVRPLKLQISGLEKEARRRESEIEVLRNTKLQLEKELNLALIEHRTKVQDMEGTFNREIAVLRFRLESSVAEAAAIWLRICREARAVVGCVVS